MKNRSCALCAMLKRLGLKKEFWLRIVDPFVLCFFHFDFLIFNFSVTI
jgi:hypothetical protein